METATTTVSCLEKEVCALRLANASYKLQAEAQRQELTAVDELLSLVNTHFCRAQKEFAELKEKAEARIESLEAALRAKFKLCDQLQERLNDQPHIVRVESNLSSGDCPLDLSPIRLEKKVPGTMATTLEWDENTEIPT